AAVHALVAETPALRTGFAQAPNGELLQIVFTTRAGHYQVLDASVGQTDDMTRLRESLRNKPRDLLRDPLFHLTLVRLGDTCYDLVIDFHHIALDGWTSALLLQRLEALYFGEASAGDNTAATGMRSYFQWLQQQAPHQARDYWRQLLGDYQGRSEVPTHRPRLPATEPRPLFVQTLAGPALNSRLVRWCEQHGVTVNAAVQALWGVFLSRLSGSDDVVFGATVSGRDIDLPGVGNIAGMLINTLPVRIRAADAASFADLVRQTAQQFAESMSYGHLTLAEIQTLSPARTALVTHALVFENYPVSDTASNRWQWQPQDIFDPMHFEFGVIVAPLAGDISFRFVADGSLFARDQLEQMGNDLCKLLLMLLDAQPATEIPVHDKPAGWSLSANFTADNLLGLLQYHEYISGHSAAVTLLPYDQSVQELINPDSRLRRLRPQQHLVLWRPVTDDSGDVLQSTAAEQLSTLAAALAACARTCTETQFYFVPCPWFRTDWHIYREFVAFAKGALAGQNNTQVLSLETLDTLYSLQQSCYPPHLVFGDIPYSDEFFAALANRLFRQRDLHNRRPIKVYVVDADDTLWGGIVGEEGVHGIRLEAVHIALQKKLLAARAAGALICLATKNNEDDVRAVFEQREMPLKWTHFTRVCAGWQPKSNSILALADDLSLGLDSFVFIDDSPLECEQVLSACPGVLAVQLPDAQHRQVFLDHLWLLDISAATREDVARARMYAEELQRAEVKKVAGSYEEFLASLDIHVDLHALQPDDLPRVAQLSQRTNQFNTTGIRYSEAQLAALLNEPDTDIRCIAVTDKYGDYGLTGSVVIRRSPTIWLVSGLMLSCRVLGRGVEHEIMRRLAQEAADSGVAELQVDFIKLPRNAPALQFLQSISVNFTETQSTDTAWQFCLPVAVAHQWQPGAMPTDHDHAAPSSNHAPKAQSAENAKQTTAALSPFTLNLSDYYQCLAETLNSGANILQALHQGSTHNGTVTSHRPENKTPPVTATELTLAGFFSELLAQPEVYREDSFNALGGHSLKAVLLFSRVAIRFGVTLDFRDLQASPGLSALAARIDALASGSDSNQAEVPALTSLPPAESYPASSGQSRLWMIEQIRAAGPSPFHMHATLTVAGVINRQALENAWQTMFLRHDALRTGFYEDEHSRIRQVVAPAMTNNDLQASRWAIQWLDDVLDDAALSSRSRQLNAEPFDLGKAPLVRMAAARLTSGRHVFFITMHHMISDGWSVGVFSRELSELYSYFSDGGQSVNLEHVAAPGALQFRDFASWQLEWLASAAGVQALQFWREHFSEPVEALQLPAAAPRPALMSSEGSSVHITIDAAIRSGFTQYLNTLGISEFSGYFAVLQLVLSRLSGQTNFCIGTAVAGRQHAQLDSVIGFFVNVLPLRSTLGKSLQRQDCVDVFMQTAASEVNDCLSHQSVPFDAIVSNLALVRDPGRTPLFDVLLVLQNADTEDLKFGDQTAQVHPVTTMASQYDLTVNACPAADGSLMLLADYNRIIYSAANIELILRCMARVMSALPACGQQAVMNV
ncbi:MAG: HAD-IIIC family phosphatase, partial [Gammaproteobacteria bacterium]|nr:HAD-IIIC family phosphatase [Gammaproteobacteria bacterium]